MTCASCGTYFSFGRWAKEIVKFSEIITPAIPIGKKGRFDGVLYEVVGFIVKRETKYLTRWREYTLFNPIYGVAYLAEYAGHWNFIYPISINPMGHQVGNSFMFEGSEYNLFQKYRTQIVYASGEFFFDIFKASDECYNYEYICPPYLLGYEVSKKSALWYKGEHLTRQEIAQAFSLQVDQLPEQSGVGSTQPAVNVRFSEKALINITLLLAALAIVLQLAFSGTSSEKTVFNGEFYKKDLPESGEKVLVTPSFEMTGGQQSVTLKIKAPVDNDWFYADMALINETTGDEFNFSKEVAYYHGYEDGSSWSEGSTIGEAFLSQIPEGIYHLVIYPEFSVATSFTLWIVRDVSAPSNMFITIAIIAIFPAVFFIYKYNREKKRWSESDYSPYHDDE